MDGFREDFNYHAGEASLLKKAVAYHEHHIEVFAKPAGDTLEQKIGKLCTKNARKRQIEKVESASENLKAGFKTIENSVMSSVSNKLTIHRERSGVQQNRSLDCGRAQLKGKKSQRVCRQCSKKYRESNSELQSTPKHHSRAIFVASYVSIRFDVSRLAANYSRFTIRRDKSDFSSCRGSTRSTGSWRFVCC